MTRSSIMRWAYLKNGDVVQQLERARSDDARLGGPDAFLADFLRSADQTDLLLMGQGTHYRQVSNERIQAITYPVRGGRLRRFGCHAAASVSVFRRLMAFRPDRIICGRVGGWFWSATLVSRLLDVPLVHSRHGRLPDANDPPLRRLSARIDGWCMRRARSVICHGPYLRESLAKSGVRPEKLFDFDVDLSGMLAVRAASSLDFAGAKVVLYCGRINENKGVFDLLHAMEPCLREDRDSLLAYAGMGSDFARLEAAVRERGLQDRVALLGELTRGEVVGVMQRSRVLVAPTRPELGEGRCMSAMEGLVQGLPVVAPNFGAFLHLVEPGVNGLLYESGSVKELAAVLQRLLADDDLHARLAAGALRSGRDFCGRQRTFVQALEQAFG